MRRFLACAVVLLCGCSTPYQPAGFLGGYSETRLSPVSYKVFAEADSEQRAVQMVELRAAELTLNSGFQRFAVLSKNVRTERHINQVPGTSYAHAIPTAGGGFSGVTVIQTPPHTQVINIGKAELTIQMLKGTSDKGIDAAAVQARLAPLLKNG